MITDLKPFNALDRISVQGRQQTLGAFDLVPGGLAGQRLSRPSGPQLPMKAGPKPKHDRAREMTPAVIYALNHPVRRQILRLLHQPGKEASPSDMHKSIGVGLSVLSFHAQVLGELGVTHGTRTQQVRGAIEHFYASDVAGNELVEAILLQTEVDDSRRP